MFELLANFDYKPDVINPTKATNWILGALGLLILAGTNGGAIWAVSSKSDFGINLILLVLITIGGLMQTWGWIQYFIALFNPTEASTFRSWRINILNILFNSGLSVLEFIVIILLNLIWVAAKLCLVS